MKNFGIKLLLVASVFVLIQACGESEEERRAREQARMDSLRQVQQQQIAEQMAAMQDSLDAAGGNEQTTTSTPQTGSYSFVEDGQYAVQVGAFRSEEKANAYVTKWSDRNYPNSYVVKVGNEEWGDVWFRVRVGFFGNKEEAGRLGAELAREINSSYWVSKVR